MKLLHFYDQILIILSHIKTSNWPKSKLKKSDAIYFHELMDANFCQFSVKSTKSVSIIFYNQEKIIFIPQKL